MLADAQPAVDKITSRGISLSFAFEDTAALVLWLMNLLVSMPAAFIALFVHLDMVSLETLLCGCMKLMNSLVSVFRKGSVLGM